MGTIAYHLGVAGHRQRVARIAREAMELPVARWLARPLYVRYFRRPYRHGNLYHGVFDHYPDALAQARALSSTKLPADYDVEAAGRMYRAQLHHLRACDYPAMFWFERALARGARRVFDLGGHIGLAYYGFGRYLDLPSDLTWHVHDLPHVVEAGKAWAATHDASGRLQFGMNEADADGCDFLISTGALQYLDYSLPELLSRLRRQPKHVVFNLTPMHPEESYFTLQNLGIALCPYRIESIAGMREAMTALGYGERDHWELAERHVRIPFERGHDIDRYYGFYFERSGAVH